MTWIKICGTTNIDDALEAVEAGADALGFVFYEKSPRHVSTEVVRDIVSRLPEHVEKIGVVPGFSAEEFRNLSDRCGLTGIQIHAPFVVSGASAKATGVGTTLKKIYLSFSMDDLMGPTPSWQMDFSSFNNLAGMAANPFQAIFLDSGTSQLPGGSGMTFDWERAAALVEHFRAGIKVVVAGGLNPANVAEAIRILNPWGVDVVSGVEASSGKKDPAKIRAFIKTVRALEKVPQ